MRYMKIKRVIGLVVLLTVAGVALASIPAARANDDYQAPVLPSPTCDNLQVPPGNEVAFHAYALGVQIYKWYGAIWESVKPEATLCADPDYRGKVGAHYRGPTWESNSGSDVVGKRLAGCSPERSITSTARRTDSFAPHRHCPQWLVQCLIPIPSNQFRRTASHECINHYRKPQRDVRRRRGLVERH